MAWFAKSESAYPPYAKRCETVAGNRGIQTRIPAAAVKSNSFPKTHNMSLVDNFGSRFGRSREITLGAAYQRIAKGWD
jgi:hypothetical protein